MAEYIEREALRNEILKISIDTSNLYGCGVLEGLDRATKRINEFPAADVVEVCRCQNCIHSVPFERNCELNSTAYMHCTLGRGEETLNVWHKYKKYYRDYSVVDRDGFCDEGERRSE